MRPVVPVALLFLILATSSSANFHDLQVCLERDANRARCFAERLPDTPAGLPGALTALSSLEEPSAVLEGLGLVADRFGDAPNLDPALRADLLDLRGRALGELGRHDEAAVAYDAALDLDDGASRLTWFGPDGAEWSAALDLGNGRLARAARCFSAAERQQDAKALESRIETLDPKPAEGVSPMTPLVGRRWHPTLIDIEIPLLEGGSLPLAEARGQVLVLEFWATWCAPCWDTLPALQRLYEGERERGLSVIAVNAKENRQVALPIVRELGLTMPIGEYTEEIDQLFQVQTLPTVIVADRMGRVRGRWDRHEIGVVEDVFALVRRLIDETDGGTPDPPVAQVIKGGGLFEIEWMRRTPARLHGLVLVPPDDEPEGILVAQGGSLTQYGRDGRIARKWSVPAATGLLRRGDSTAEGEFALVGFRPGGDTLILLDMPEGRLDSWEAPAPVFDAAPLHQPGSPREVVAGTRDSLIHLVGERLSGPPGDLGLVSSLARIGSKADTRMVTLSPGSPGPGHLVWLDRSLKEAGRIEVPANSWRLIVDPDRSDRVGVASSNATAAAVGSFLEPGSSQAFMATRTGQLILIDLADGAELFRARWGEEFISHLAAGDLDGDGTDELVAATGQDLFLLDRGSP